MLVEIAKRLDAWIAEQNVAAREAGVDSIGRCRIRLLGQMALFEQRVQLHLVATNDVDVYGDYEPVVERELARLLQQAGKQLDPLGQEVWMPKDTRYERLFAGAYVTLDVAEPEAVLVSKGLKALDKNRALITEYLAGGPSPRFMELAARYKLDLEAFL